MALCSFSFVACSDDDYIPGKSELDADRELMTMFRVDDNSNKGDTDPYRCQVVNINDVQLRWYGVDGDYKVTCLPVWPRIGKIPKILKAQ